MPWLVMVAASVPVVGVVFMAMADVAVPCLWPRLDAVLMADATVMLMADATSMPVVMPGPRPWWVPGPRLQWELCSRLWQMPSPHISGLQASATVPRTRASLGTAEP